MGSSRRPIFAEGRPVREFRAIGNLLCLLCLVGAFALGQTGEFPRDAIALSAAGIGFAWGRLRWGPRRSMARINFVTVLLFGATLVMAKWSLIDSAVVFLSSLAVVQLLNWSKLRDALWIHAIVYFQVVGSAALTTSMTFAVVYAVYVCVAVASLVSLHMAREKSDALAAGEEAVAMLGRMRREFGLGAQLGPAERRPDGRLGLGVFGAAAGTASLGLLLILLSCGLFMVIPRLSTQRVLQSSAPKSSEPAVSAFGDTVEFGAFESISLDASVALYARPAGEPISNSIRLRGVALDYFDGQRWKRTSPPRAGVPFGPFTRRIFPLAYHTIIHPGNKTNYLFGVWFPQTLRLNQDMPIIFDPVSNSAWLPDVLAREIHYSVVSQYEAPDQRGDPQALYPSARPSGQSAATSRLPFATLVDRVANAVRGDSPSPGYLRHLGARNRSLRSDTIAMRNAFLERLALPGYYRERCLDIPDPIDRARIAKLAAEMGPDATTPFQKAVAIERMLRTTYSYSLKPTATGNFIEDFLFRTRSGHCEYFATAMAMLLRSQGVPARIVNGYYCNEWNPMAKAFVVRQSDAHSWVEAYFENYGWMTFDPTPASGLSRRSPATWWLAGLDHFADAMKVQWYRYVVDYDFRDQISVIRGVIGIQQFFGGLFQQVSLIDLFGGRLSLDPAGQGMLLAGAAIMALGAAATAIVILRVLRGRSTAGARRGRGKAVRIRFFAIIVKLLDRWGVRAAPHETPLEFARRVKSDQRLAPLEAITHWYYAARYGDRDPDDSQIRDIADFTDRLRRGRRRR